MFCASRLQPSKAEHINSSLQSAMFWGFIFKVYKKITGTAEQCSTVLLDHWDWTSWIKFEALLLVTALFCTQLCKTSLGCKCIALPCTAPCCTWLSCTVLHLAVLQYIALDCIALQVVGRHSLSAIYGQLEAGFQVPWGTQSNISNHYLPPYSKQGGFRFRFPSGWSWLLKTGKVWIAMVATTWTKFYPIPCAMQFKEACTSDRQLSCHTDICLDLVTIGANNC